MTKAKPRMVLVRCQTRHLVSAPDDWLYSQAGHTHATDLGIHMSGLQVDGHGGIEERVANNVNIAGG